MAKQRTISMIALIVFTIVIAIGVYGRWRIQPLNVILITFDTTRADHLGVYGYQQGLTAEFDKFAKRGVVFERAYAPAPITLPSHATMLTGLYPPEHGLRLNGEGRLADKIPLLPAILQQHGFDTAAFIAAFVLDSQYGLARGFDTYDDDLSKSPQAEDYEERRRNGDEIVDSALAWLSKRTSRPFFCWIHFFDAHGPYDPRQKKFGDKFITNPYDAGIAVELSAFDRLVSFLREKTLTDNTVIIVAADHGEGLGEHMENEHSMLVYNSTLHVPLIFVNPRLCRPGLRISSSVSLVDLTPTVLDILRIPAPKHVSGRSLKEGLRGGKLTSSACYAEAETPYWMNRWCPLKTVISDKWKYIQTNQPELYNLQNDPGELVNLAPEHFDLCKEQQNILELLEASFEHNQAQRVKPSEKDRATLEGLGYVAEKRNDNDHVEISMAGLPDVKEMLPYLAQYEKARLLCLNERFIEAIPLLQEVTKERPDYAGAFLLLGNSLFNLNQLEDAVAAYQPAIALRPDFLTARMNLARTFAKLKKYEDAEAVLRAVLERETENSFPHFQLAEVLRVREQFDLAIAEYQEAIRISPHYALASLQLGRLMLQLDRSQEAVACFKRALDNDPSDVAVLASLLKILVQQREYDVAIEYCQRAAKVSPASFEVRHNFGFLLILKKRYAEALVELGEAHRLRPDDPRPQQLISQAEAALRQLNK